VISFLVSAALVVLVVAYLVTWVWGVVDTATLPRADWQEAGQSKAMWVALTAVVGPVATAFYLVFTRPKVQGRPVAQSLREIGVYLGLSLLSLIVLFPVWMILVRAVSQPLSYLTAGQPARFVDPEWDVFTRAFTKGELGRKLGISAMATVVIAGAQVATSILAAYAFAFLRFPFRRTAFVAFMATLMLPIEVTLIANVETVRGLGWFNSLPGLTAPFLAAAFGTFLIRQGFLGIPADLRDAAELDGLGHMGFLRNVAIPVTRPIIASFTVIAFLGAWNQYLWPRAIITREAWDTIQIALPKFAGENINQLNLGFAAAIIAALPILAILIFFQRHLIRGLTAGAVKG
jgi:sn-glycerol 3-phosphate transport system permease protein